MEALSWHVILPAVGAAFLASLVEVVEAFTIVLAVGTTRGWRPALQGSLAGLALLAVLGATLGAVAACALVLAIGVAVHRPLARVPENSLKFAVGVLLAAFGVFWTGEGLGIDWPGGDLVIVAFVAMFLVVGLLSVAAAKMIALEE